MKRFFLVAALVATGATFAGAGEPPIEFAGVLNNGKDTQVSLRETGGGQTRWVVIGREFAGYTVVSYQAKDDTVTLSRDGKQFTVQLKSARKVKPGTAKLSPEVEKGILNNLRQ